MNRQEIFNTVRDHLLKQNKKAINDTDECLYLTPDGLKCAIGCLIPDGHPAQMNDPGVHNLLLDHPDLVSLWGVESFNDQEFLYRLQGVHDSHDPDTWAYKLTKFANERDLTP